MQDSEKGMPTLDSRFKQCAREKHVFVHRFTWGR